MVIEFRHHRRPQQQQQLKKKNRNPIAVKNMLVPPPIKSKCWPHLTTFSNIQQQPTKFNNIQQ